MNKRIVRWWLLLSVVLAVALAPLLTVGNQQAKLQEATNREIIRTMSQSERARLERNHLAFEQLDEQQVVAMKQFHQQLESDKAEHGGELVEAMDLYNQWLGTIEPYQRDQLRRISDPAQRLKLMKEIVEDQKRRKTTRLLVDTLSNESERDSREFRNSFFQAPVLNGKDLENLMNALARLESGKLGVDDKAKLESKSGLDRYVFLIRTIRENTTVPPSENSRGIMSPEFRPAFQKIAEQITSLTEDEAVHKYVTETKFGPHTPSAEFLVYLILSKSLTLRAIDNEKQISNPSRSERESYFENQLSEAEQDHLFTLDALSFWDEIGRKMAASAIDEITDTSDVRDAFLSKERQEELRKERDERMKQFRSGRPDWSRRDGDGPPPDRDADGRPRPGVGGPRDGESDRNGPPPQRGGFGDGPPFRRDRGDGPPPDRNNEDRPRPEFRPPNEREPENRPPR